MSAPSNRLPRRDHSVLSSFVVGVVNVNVNGRASFRPLTAAAVAAMVTW
jgi:hypothetical protein